MNSKILAPSSSTVSSSLGLCTSSASRARRLRHAGTAAAVVALASAASAWMGCGSHDLTGAGTSALASPNATAGLVISQIYGGGGNSGATYTNDFIELFNAGATSVSVAGMSVQYASYDEDNWSVHILSTTAPAIAPGSYFLVQLASGGTGGTTSLPTPDDTSTINMSSTSGQVALVNGTSPLSCYVDGTPNNCQADTVDYVGYGSAKGYAGSGPAPTLSATTAGLRLGGGCTESDDNAADFATPAPAPSPRNSGSTVNLCGAGVVDSGTPDSGPPDSGTTIDSGGGGIPDGGDVSDATPPPKTGNGAGIVISQVFGAGGNNGAPLDSDYVELFNTTTAPVSLSGLSIQYGSTVYDFAETNSDGGIPNLVVLPAVSIPAGGYYLVAMGTPNMDAGGTALPTPDWNGTASLGASAGKVALASTTTPLGCGATGNLCPTTDIVDLVGYGAVSDFEGSPAMALSATLAAFRNGNGCDDTNNNADDFTAAAPAPRNGETAVNICAGGGGGADGGTSPSDGGTRTVIDAGTSPVSGDDDDDDSAQDASTLGTGAGSSSNQGVVTVDDPNSGGCSTSGSKSPFEGALSFGASVALVLASSVRRRRRQVR